MKSWRCEGSETSSGREGLEGHNHSPDRKRPEPESRQQPAREVAKKLDVWLVLRAGKGSPGFLLYMS